MAFKHKFHIPSMERLRNDEGTFFQVTGSAPTTFLYSRNADEKSYVLAFRVLGFGVTVLISPNVSEETWE